MIETQVTTWALDRLPASCAGAARGGVVATVGRRIATLSSMPREFQTIPGPADDEDEEEDEDEDAGGGGGNIEPDDDEGYDDEDDDDDEEPWQVGGRDRECAGISLGSVPSLARPRPVGRLTSKGR